MIALRFSVEGRALPKGSTRAFIPKGWTRAVVTANNPRTKVWEQQVRSAAIAHVVGELKRSPEGGAFRVVLRFVLPRPKRLKHASPHTKRPDVDKLARCILDALTGVVWLDDSQVVSMRAAKRYARQEEPARVDVYVTGGLDGG